MSRPSLYELVVFAATEEEALEIGREGLPSQADIIEAEAQDASGEEGDDAWRVVIRYRVARRGKPRIN